jgi:iron complex outermembrane receptor protein
LTFYCRNSNQVPSWKDYHFGIKEEKIMKKTGEGSDQRVTGQRATYGFGLGLAREAFLLGICFVVLIAVGAAWGQESGKEAGKETAPSEGKKDYAVFNLGEVYVTSGKPPAVQETAITNEVTAEEIEATNSHTVAEALTYVPGLRVSTGRKNQPQIQIHGLGQSRILVLIDGVPYYETRYGFLDLNQIPVDNVAKIEVIKGAPSVLYGPNALIGVVNIITKKGTKKVAAQATVETGPNYTNRESLSHGWQVGMLNYWLNYGHQQTDGWRMSDDFHSVIGNQSPGIHPVVLEGGGLRNNSDYNQHSVWAKIGIDPSPGSEYFVNAHYITKEKGDPPSIFGGSHFTTFPAFSAIYDRITKYDNWGIDFSGQQKIFDQLTLTGKAYYHDHVDDYTSYSDQFYSNILAVSRFKDYTVGGYVIGDYRPIEWDAIRFSFHYKGDSHQERDDESLPFADYFSTTGSVGLENEFNLIKNLSVVVGVSYDWFDVTKAKKNVIIGGVFDHQEPAGAPDLMDSIDPMIGATYTFPDATRIFGSIARKVRFPTLDQLYSSNSGNLNLKPERAINYTLGVSRSFSRYAHGELAWFYHDFSDFISRDANHIENPSAQYQNFSKIEMTGFELSGEVYPLKDFPLWEDLTLWADYTFNYARDRSSGHVTDKVAQVPAHKVDVGLHLTIPYIDTGLDLIGVYMGKIYSQLPTPARPTQAIQKVDDSFTMNLRISKVFFKYFEAYVAINNIFDSDYQSEYGFPAPGRNFYFGISAKY